MAPALTIVVAAPPVKGVKVGDTGVVVLVLLPLVELPDTRVKLAQVRRVVLLVWMTMERLPKNDPGPSAVDRYRSRKLDTGLLALQIAGFYYQGGR